MNRFVLQLISYALLPVLLARGSPVAPPPLANFTQRVYHTSSNTTTFQQQYQLSTAFFQQGGPILLVQGGEQSLTPFQYTSFWDYAQEVGGIAASIEHRYLGNSFPPGFDNSSGSYAALTLDKVLWDSVRFVQWIKHNITGTANSPVIITGGSYGGFVVAMARVKHPDVFFGTFPVAPILTNFGTQGSNPYKYVYARAISNGWYDASFEAAQKIRSAVQVFNECQKNGEYSPVVGLGTCAADLPGLNLCDPQPTASQYSYLYRALLTAYKYMVQFDYPVEIVYPANPLRLAVNATLASASQCLNWTNSTLYADVNGAPAIEYQYLLCIYFPASNLAVPDDGWNILPPEYVEGDVPICAVPEWAVPDLNRSNDWWVDHYRLSAQHIRNLPRFTITHGSHDLTTAEGSPPLPLSSNPNDPRIIYMEGTAHGEDSYGYQILPKGIKAVADDVRAQKLEILRAWLETWAREHQNASRGG